jgi:hypothetical protein
MELGTNKNDFTSVIYIGPENVCAPLLRVQGIFFTYSEIRILYTEDSL